MVDDCGCGVCGDSNGLNAGNCVIHTGDKSGCEIVTLLALTVMMVSVVGVQHKSPLPFGDEGCIVHEVIS